jgi:DNA-binding Lrp family transcriptional regulator
MDKLDYLILAEIHKDGAISFVDIAKKVSSTPITVKRRYDKMKKNGTIYGCRISLDLGRVGYQGKAFLLFKLKPNSQKSEAAAFIKRIKDVFVLIEVNGPYDIVAIALVSDLISIQTIMTEARKTPSLEKVEFYCIKDASIPIGGNFNEVLNQRCQTIAETLQKSN